MQREHNAEIFNDPAMFGLQWNAALDDVATVDAVDQLPAIKVSILMCAFNEQRTIGRAIREVLAVDYPCEIELIVVDDGSIDATASIVAQFDDPRLIFHQHRRTRARAPRSVRPRGWPPGRISCRSTPTLSTSRRISRG